MNNFFWILPGTKIKTKNGAPREFFLGPFNDSREAEEGRKTGIRGPFRTSTLHFLIVWQIGPYLINDGPPPLFPQPYNRAITANPSFSILTLTYYATQLIHSVDGSRQSLNAKRAVTEVLERRRGVSCCCFWFKKGYNGCLNKFSHQTLVKEKSYFYFTVLLSFFVS